MFIKKREASGIERWYVVWKEWRSWKYSSVVSFAAADPEET